MKSASATCGFAGGLARSKSLTTFRIFSTNKEPPVPHHSLPSLLALTLTAALLLAGCKGGERSVELSHPWLFAINAEDEWVPREGLVWTNPDDPDDYSVRPAPGYAWAGEPGEDLIGPDGEVLPYYSRDAMGARSRPSGSEPNSVEAEAGDAEIPPQGEIIVEWIKLDQERITRYNSRVMASAGVRGDAGRRGSIRFRIRPGTGDATVFGSIPIVSDEPVVSSEISFVPHRTGSVELVAYIGEDEVGSVEIYVAAE
jgi:hypothetical protein